MKKQRITKNLGINRSRVKESIYQYIEKNFGKYKKCGRLSEKNKFGLGHEGENPLPIRNFALLVNKCTFSSDGQIVRCSSLPLQSACIICDKKYRKARIETARENFKNMSDDEIRNNYIENYGPLFTCSVCKLSKSPSEFSISKSMETGLHNQCLSCSKEYSEAVGDRWIVYSPQGRNKIRITKTSSLINPSKDHIWPLSKGGSDNDDNIIPMDRNLNSSKSNSIPANFKSPHDIKKAMISERYWPILDTAIKNNWDIKKLELALTKAVNDLISKKSKMSDEELQEFFINEKKQNNTKHNIDRAVRKFREYCKNSKSLNF